MEIAKIVRNIGEFYSNSSLAKFAWLQTNINILAACLYCERKRQKQ